ncbi:hypothetical protein ABK040_000981 [Willaertia magna]
MGAKKEEINKENDESNKMKSNNYEGITQICDTTELQECFKKFPKNRNEHCKIEIENFKKACEAKAKEFRERIEQKGNKFIKENETVCENCKVK